MSNALQQFRSELKASRRIGIHSYFFESFIFWPRTFAQRQLKSRPYSERSVMRSRSTFNQLRERENRICYNKIASYNNGKIQCNNNLFYFFKNLTKLNFLKIMISVLKLLKSWIKCLILALNFFVSILLSKLYSQIFYLYRFYFNENAINGLDICIFIILT